MDILTTIEVSVVSLDSVPALLRKVADQIQQEFHRGMLVAEDNDEVSWKTLFSIDALGADPDMLRRQ